MRVRADGSWIGEKIVGVKIILIPKYKLASLKYENSTINHWGRTFVVSYISMLESVYFCDPRNLRNLVKKYRQLLTF